MEILKKLSCAPHVHAHLINLLATYEQTGKFYLVFPWAKADLLGYWTEENPRPPQKKEMVTWIAEQCHGIADGLSTIHRYHTFSGKSLLHPNSLPLDNLTEPRTSTKDKTMNEAKVIRLFGRHGDIKPNNILWFPDQTRKGGFGILKITDFGIAHFSTKNEVSAQERDLVANSPTYRAPECDFPGWMLSPSSDLWTLGCVYLEFIVWFIGGSTRLKQFAQDRTAFDPCWHGFSTDTFFTIEENQPKVKDSVIRVSYNGLTQLISLGKR